MSVGPRPAKFATLFPGLALAAAVAAAAPGLRAWSLPGLRVMSPLLLAIEIGMLIGNTLGVPRAAQPGLAILAFGVVFTFAVVVRVGALLGGIGTLFIGGATLAPSRAWHA
jgi:uncharacterized membrane protein YadS